MSIQYSFISRTKFILLEHGAVNFIVSWILLQEACMISLTVVYSASSCTGYAKLLFASL